MAENDWFSVVKVSTVWDSNVSDERLNYFIWNAFQTDTGKLDSFYRNNYYTFYELADKHTKYIEENTPERNSSQYKYFMGVYGEVRKQLDSMQSNTNRYLESLSLFQKHTNQKNESVLSTLSAGKTVTIDSLPRLSKKEFTDVYETVKEYLLSLGSRTAHNRVEDDLKKQIKHYSVMLSKRLPSGINLTNPYNQAVFHFKNTIREYK